MVTPRAGIRLLSLRVQKRPMQARDGAEDPQEILRSLRVALDGWQEDAAARGEEMPDAGWVLTNPHGAVCLRMAEAGVDLPEGVVGPTEVARALAAARQAPSGTVVLHAFADGYRIDDGPIVPDPRGHHGAHLRACVRLACVPAFSGDHCGDHGPAGMGAFNLQALDESLARAGILAEAPIAGGLAAALGTVTEAERQQGAIVIEIGARHTRLAAFERGMPVLLDSFALGGAHVTADLAALWGGNFASAERIKLRHIDVSPAACEDPALITVARIAGDGRLAGGEIARGVSNRAAAARIEEILEIARDRLAPLRAGDAWFPVVALTGGGANLPGIRDRAQSILGMSVRIAPPLALAPDGQGVPAGLASLIGAIAWQSCALPDLQRRRPSGPNRHRARDAAGRHEARPDGQSAGLAATWDWIATTF